MTSLLRTLFAGPQSVVHVRGGLRRSGFRRHAGRVAEAVRPGLESLERRSMLAANDAVVSLVGDRVSLALDPLGAEITNLETAYDATSGVLTITAATVGTISTKGKIAGISVDTNADTISVNLKTLPKFVGLSVVGGGGTDSVRVGNGGVNLAAVGRGAVWQGVSINTGAGTDDTITVAGPLVTKGAGAIKLVTQGQSESHGIRLAAGTGMTTPSGSQTFTGAVTVLGDVELRAGGAISFSSTVDGAGRLSLSAGGAITFAGDVGGATPLQGITLAKASRVAVSEGLSLDGTGTAAGMSGLVIGKNVHNVVFSTKNAASYGGRTISGFSGSGIEFLGGSVGSRISGVTSTDNGVGIAFGSGSYAGTVISDNIFNQNDGAGVSLVGARGVRIGGNGILWNGTFGIAAAGVCQGSVVVDSGGVGDSNPLGQIQNYTDSSVVGTRVIQNGTGLQLPLNGFYLAQKALTTADWYFPTSRDPQVAADGVIWLQRDGGGDASSFAALAKELAQQTNSIVVAPQFRSLENPGPSVSGADLQDGVAELFKRDEVNLSEGIDRPALTRTLTRSAADAGYQGLLPEKFLLAGVGKGAGFVTSVGGATVDSGAAVNLLGVVMYDGVADAEQFSTSIAKLDSLDIPCYQIVGPPGRANAGGRTTDLLAALHPSQFIGIETSAGAMDVAITASVGWIKDICAGKLPSDPAPKFGIYGDPNDGTYVAGQRVAIGGGTATVLPLFTGKDIVGTRGESIAVDIAFPGRNLTGTTFAAYVYAPGGKIPSVTSKVTVVSASEGTIRVSLTAAQTAELKPSTSYRWSLRQTYGDGFVKTTDAGEVTVKNSAP